LVDPPSLANTALGIGISLTVLAGFFVAARIYINFKHLVFADCKYDFLERLPMLTKKPSQTLPSSPLCSMSGTQ
jgi:hypothetical protein